MISSQYKNLELDEELSSTHENSSNAELLALWASFMQVYIDTIDSWTEYIHSGNLQTSCINRCIT